MDLGTRGRVRGFESAEIGAIAVIVLALGDFDFWLPNESEMQELSDRVRAVSQQRLDQLSR